MEGLDIDILLKVESKNQIQATRWWKASNFVLMRMHIPQTRVSFHTDKMNNYVFPKNDFFSPIIYYDMNNEIIQGVACFNYDDFNMSISYFHKISFHYFGDYLMMKLTLRQGNVSI